MADEPAAAAPAAPAPAQGTDLGGTLRVTPKPEGEANPTLEETAAAQALANETPEQKAAREAEEAKAPKEVSTEETPEQKAAREAEEAKAPAKGGVFEGLSEEMQAKVAPYAAAYAANGTLTDAEVSEAAKATGFSEAAVRQFMAGAEATASSATAPIYEAFGGKDQFAAFQGWTQTEGNLTERETATINKALAAGDAETAAELMKAPMERWKADGGGKPARDVTNNSQGATPPGDGGDRYESWAQLTADQAKPEYSKDPAFRAKVEAKVARSPALG